METSKTLMKDENAKDVDVHLYRSMVGSLMYLTSSRPDIMFVVCACARFQVTPKVLHLHAVKRIFRYLKGQPKLGLWYPKHSPFNLEAYTDTDYVGASLNKKSTTGVLECLTPKVLIEGRLIMLIYIGLYTNDDWNEVKQLLRIEFRLTLFWATTTAKNINGEAQIHAKVDGNKVIISEATIRRDLMFEDECGVDCLSNEVIFEQLPLMGVLNLETTKTAQAKKISILKKKVNRLERKNKLRTHRLKRLYKVGISIRVESSAEEQSLGEDDASNQGRNIADIDANAEITLIDETTEDQGRYDDQEMFDTNVLDDEEEVLLKEAQDVPNVVEKVIEDITTARIKETVSTAALITTADVTPDELNMAQALMEIKKSKPKGATTTTTVMIPTPDSTRPKARGVVMQEPSETLTTTIPKSSQVKTNEKLIEDENLAWDNVQAMMNANYELATRLQEEQGELTIEEKSRLFVELMDKRKKRFAKLRAEEKRREENH
nr:uncharacterized mitochondrial protein AtMg00810-like [Tanacetum cinerariifolium]